MFDSHHVPSQVAASPGDGQRRKRLRPSGARWGALVGAALLSGLLLIPEAAFAGRGRSSAPSDSSSQGSRVSRSSPSSSGSAGRTRSSSSSGSRSSSPRSSSSSSGSGSAPVRVTRPGSRGSATPPSDSGDYPRRIENRRGYDGRHHGGHGYYGGRHYGSDYYIGYYGPYWAYWPYWGGHRYYWGSYWGGYWGAPPVYYTSRSADLGGLDLDISPEKAEVYLDGHYIGVADDFDGFPAYLWLEPGTYDLVFYQEGYGTEARRYKIVPGLIIDVEDEMQSGTSVSPDEALTAWIESEGEIEQRQDRRERYADREDRDWDRDDRYDEWEARRERRRAERGRVESGSARQASPAPRAQAAGRYDAREEPGRLALRLAPSDASVYLDGRFLGTARELAEVSAGLIVDPGEHVLELVRPGYRSDKAEFDVESGEEVTVELSLTEEIGR